MLNNQGNVKRLINTFMRNSMTEMKNQVKHDKRDFIPFVDERD